MAKKFKKILALALVVSMLASMMVMTVQAEEGAEDPKYTVALIPGQTTNAVKTVSDAGGDTIYTITAVTSAVETTKKQTASEFVAPQSALKFDRNDTADQTAQRKVRDLYTDNGHFTDPDSITVTGAPEGYPFQYVGTGDYSGHYVSHIRVIYDRNDDGTPKVDENGNYIIKELQHSDGTPLTIDLQPTTSFDGPYDQTTGTRPLQFLLKNAAGDTVYAYCIDVETGTADGDPWYAVANLEDNDYYASQEAEDHVRGIIFNGYWGTDEGTGSLTQLKADLKAALAANEIDTYYNVNFRNRAKISTGTKDEEGNLVLADNQYASENYIYTKLNQEVTLTDAVIDGLTEGEALDAMQCAIWSWANGSRATLDGVDGMIVGDLYYASSAMGDSRNGANDFEGAARTKALYQYLMQQTASATSVIVNDETFAKDITLSLGKKDSKGSYDAAVKFAVEGYVPGEKDELSVTLTYVNAAGETVVVEKALTGEGAMVAENGCYTIDGLKLSEKNGFAFTLNITGKQYLEKNAYIYTAQLGTNGSQTMVSMAEGCITVDISKTMNTTFKTDKVYVPVKPETPVDKTAEPLDENDQTNVTLTVGGQNEGPVDIVIALGAGIAQYDADNAAGITNTYDSIVTLVEPLVENGIGVKLGLIAVEHYDDVAMELTELTKENYKQVITAGLDVIQAMPAGPTNLHGNLVAAKAMLDADEDVPASHKFFYVIGTGRTYNYDNADGVPTTIINKVTLKGADRYYWGHYLWQSQRGRHTSLYMIPARYENDFSKFWADVEKWVVADGDTYAYSFTEDYDPADPQWFNDFMAVNGIDAKTLGLASSKYGWILPGLTGSGLPAIGSGADPQNALNYERAQYEAYQVYQTMKKEGYNCYALCSESVKYQNGSPYIQYIGYTGTSTIQLGHSFMNYLAGEDQDYTAPLLFQMTDDSGNYKVAENFFPAITIGGYSDVSVGSYVEDFIGYDEYKGNFEFIQDASTMVLTVGSKTYTAAQIETKAGATSSYAFTAAGAAEPTFWLDYYYGDGKTTEKFIWTFGETVTSFAPVSLTYKLQLTEKVTEVQIQTDFLVYTNNSAILYPTDSDGVPGEPKVFPVPSVIYTVKPYVPEELGTKKAELVDRYENRFNVTIEVPGKDGDNRHDEVILMVDGSYSLDNEWPAMKEAINTIAKTVLNGSGSTQLTLMAFGMGDNEVIVHATDADDVAAALGELPGSLLYGRSSTNCEAGFDGVANYIKNHDESLKDVHVIFISDGNLNTDETPRAFDANWQTWTKFGALTVAQEAFGGTVENGENLPAAFTTVFGSRFDGMTREEIIASAFSGSVSDEEFLLFAEQLWTDVYAYSGLTRGTEYPVSVAERAFVKYDKEKGTYIQDLFYYTTYKSSYVTYGDRWTRTPIAADELAAMNEVAAMYVVDYDGYTAWMDTGITNEKSTFVQSNGIAGLCEALEGALNNLSKTPFNDVFVTDYMSKWVNLIPDTIKIIDSNTDTVIWTAKDGWTEGVTPTTAKNPPVVVELVDPADYEAGGSDVIGNTTGDIYKLTWYVKDGAMLRADNYELSYDVTVDTKELNFSYDVEYPANGNTDLTYTDEFKKEHTNKIDVPNVDTISTELPLLKVDINNVMLSGAEFTLTATGKTADSYYAGGTAIKYAVDGGGRLILDNLAPGAYQLVETKAPAGYLTAADPINIKVDVVKDEAGAEKLVVSVEETSAAKLNSANHLVVTNYLPDAAVVLTIDMSGTMYRNKMNGQRYVDVAKAKAQEFLNTYAASAVNGAKRMLAVVCFDTDAKVQQTWVDVSTAAGLKAAEKAIKNIKVADNGNASSNQVCTNFDGGVILTRNLLKQDTVAGIDRRFAIILSDGAPTVTVNADTDTVGTIKSSFWGDQLDASGKKYQNARAGGGWTHPAEVARTLTYLKGVADLTCTYKDADGNDTEGVFIVGVGGLMDFELFYDAVYGTSNGTRTSDVKRKPAAFNNIDALAGYTQAQILKLTTGDWMTILAGKVGGTYESAKNAAALQAEFTTIVEAIKANTTPVG